MTVSFSKLADRIAESPQRSSRQGAKIDHVILHHQAGTNAAAVIRAMQSGSRQVSANYVVTNEGEVVGVVDEEDRAWTSGSTSDGGKGAAWDRRSITFEIENESAGGTWPVSAKAEQAVAEVLVDLHRRRGLKLDREHVLGHRDLWTKYKASYPTACPGGLNIARVLERADALLNPSERRTMFRLLLIKKGVASSGNVYERFTPFGIITQTYAQAKLYNTQAGTESAVDGTTAAVRDAVRSLWQAEIDANKAALAAAVAAGPAAAISVSLAPVLQAIADIPAAVDAALDDEQAQVLTALAGLPASTLQAFGLARIK